jgi:hypothetical protein
MYFCMNRTRRSVVFHSVNKYRWKCYGRAFMILLKRQVCCVTCGQQTCWHLLCAFRSTEVAVIGAVHSSHLPRITFMYEVVVWRITDLFLLRVLFSAVPTLGYRARWSNGKAQRLALKRCAVGISIGTPDILTILTEVFQGIYKTFQEYQSSYYLLLYNLVQSSYWPYWQRLV